MDSRPRLVKFDPEIPAGAGYPKLDSRVAKKVDSHAADVNIFPVFPERA